MENADQQPPVSAPEVNQNTRLIVVVILLIFVYPIGVIMMWQWMRYWPWWVKLLITLPLIAAVVAIVLFFVIRLEDPNKILEKSQGTTAHVAAEDFVNATDRYVIKKNEFPCALPPLAPGRPLSELGACIDSLISAGELDRGFLSSPALGAVNVHYDEIERTLFACVENGCASKVIASSEFTDPSINLQLPSPTPSGPPPLFPEQ